VSGLFVTLKVGRESERELAPPGQTSFGLTVIGE
jgi:hypothetical protein